MKFDINVASLMGQRDISLSSSPFAPGKAILKRASFPKGVIPSHLSGYLIKAGECAGRMGTVVYKGKLVPGPAKCVAEKHGR